MFCWKKRFDRKLGKQSIEIKAQKNWGNPKFYKTVCMQWGIVGFNPWKCSSHSDLDYCLVFQLFFCFCNNSFRLWWVHKGVSNLMWRAVSLCSTNMVLRENKLYIFSSSNSSWAALPYFQLIYIDTYIFSLLNDLSTLLKMALT